MKVVGFLGLPGSGKTEAAKVAEDAGAAVVRMGDVVRSVVEEQGLEITEENVGRVATELRQQQKGAVAKRCIPEIEALGKTKLVCIDGVRDIFEVRIFRKRFREDFYLVAIEAPAKTRFERVYVRKRQDDALTWQAFLEKDQRELEWGMEEAFKAADRHVENTDTLLTFQEEIKHVLSEVIKSDP